MHDFMLELRSDYPHYIQSPQTMRIKVAIGLLQLWMSLHAFAADVFHSYEPRPFKLGDRLEANATIGGYPIWNGEGQWQLFGIKTSQSGGIAMPVPMGTVSVFQVEGKRFVAMMEVKANLSQGWSSDWTDEPCKRDDMLFKATIRESFKHENCVTINHNTGFLNNPSGSYADLYAFSRKEEIEIPPTVLKVTFTRYSPNLRWLSLALTINPELAGFARDAESWGRSSWNKSQVLSDPAKKQFIDALGGWAMKFLAKMDSAFEKNPNAFSGILSWRSIYDERHGSGASPHSTTAAPSSSGSAIGKPETAERLRKLNALYKENLISIDDYEKKKQEILSDM